MSAGGAIESPSPGTSAVRESLVVGGWALLPAATVARIEVRVGECTVGLARLGLSRPDIAAATGRADAPVSGFDYPVPARSLPSEHTEIDVDALVHGVDGSCVALPAVTVSLTPAEPVSPEAELEAAGLRERVRSAVRTETLPRTGARVLVITSSLNRGAASRALFHLLRRLVAEDGLSCDVVTAETGPYVQRLEAAGVPVHVTPAWSARDARGYEGGLAPLAAWASGQAFDVVVVDGPEAFAGADLAARVGIPAVWSVGDGGIELDPRLAAVGGYARGRAVAAWGSAPVLAFDSEGARAAFGDGGSPGRCVTLPPVVEAGEIDAYRRRVGRKRARRLIGLPEDARVVLCPEPIAPENGQVAVALAFASIAAHHPEAVLVLAGDRVSPYAEGLRGYIDRAGLTSRVTIAPEPDDPYLWHRAAHAVVCASDVSASPAAAIEAMAFEALVLSTRASGAGTPIEDGASGFLCEARDVEDLARALDRVLGLDSRERRAVRAAASARMAQRLTPRACVDRWSHVLRALLDDPRARPGEILSAGGGPDRRTRLTVPETVSIMVPTRDAGPGFARSLEAMRAQEGLGGLELVVVDSGSTDDTVAIARAAGATVAEIEPEEFNHGRVRNQLAEMAAGEVLLATVQDATPIGRHVLRDLVLRLREDPGLAAVSGLQVPGRGADLYSAYQGWRHNEILLRTPGAPEGTQEWAAALVDDVCAAIRRPAWEELRFRELAYGEDIDLGLRAVASGWRTAFSASARVEHHHDREASYLLRRSVVHHLLLADLLPRLARIPGFEGGPSAVIGALPAAFGQVESALSLALSDRTGVALGPFLEALAQAFQKGAGPTEPTGELASACRLLEDQPAAEDTEAIKALLAWVTHAFFDPWLRPFALAHPEPVSADAARSFAARLVAGNLGQVVGDAMRDGGEPGLARRLGRGL